MVKAKTTSGKATKNDKVSKFKNLFENTPRNFRLGGDIQPRRDVTRFVRWPKYILLQRQRRILYKRLKVPAAVHQFTNTLTADKTKNLFKLLAKYKPETKAAKKARLHQEAEAKKNKQEVQKTKPKVLKTGLNHVTTLVENKLAKLVVIAHDVDPIELVVWLPHLCRNKEVPYCFVKAKSRLGQLVGLKTASCLALTDVNKEDQAELERLTNSFKVLYNQNKEHLTKHGDIVLGSKAQHRIEMQRKAKEAELMQKA